MYNEHAVFSISSEAMRNTDKDASRNSSNTITRWTLNALEETQPELMSYICENLATGELDEHAYMSGVVTTYFCLSNQFHLDGNIPFLEKGNVCVHEKNMTDQQVFEITDEEPNPDSDGGITSFAEIGINRFLSELELSSPEFTQWIYDHVVDGCKSPAEEKSFIRGVYDVFMPFYKKHEAALMYDQLIWMPGLIEAFESGYYKYDDTDLN